MVKHLVIVGGGTAGWLSAAYLARTLNAASPAGVRITLIESADIPTLGVGEGTFPSLQRTLRRIGADEAQFLRECHATFKQGIRFDNWRYEPGRTGRNHYFHPFASGQVQGDLDLLPYWLLGCAGEGVELDEAVAVQKAVADAARGPKRITDGEFGGPLSYAYHFDAGAFAAFLRRHAIGLGVRRLVGTVEAVNLDAGGAIASLTTREHGELTGDLYVDCTGLRGRLIGQALKSPYRSVKPWLFCDRAVAIQVPYPAPDAPIASYTLSTAKEAGWIWDIGLDARRGTGHVYSSAHTDDARAEEVLRSYLGPAAAGCEARTFRFDPGYRETPWVRNCVAIGLSGAFFEPLEATGIVLIEVASILLANLFPWAGALDTAARQFNRVMKARYEQVLDFIKLHYSLTERRDTAFWRDNADPKTAPESLLERLDNWRHRPPSDLDFDPNTMTFHPASWHFILYGMGFRTDLTAKAGAYRYYDEARQAFAGLREQAARAPAALPSHRDLIREIYANGYRRPQPAGMTFASGLR